MTAVGFLGVTAIVLAVLAVIAYVITVSTIGGIVLFVAVMFAIATALAYADRR